MYKKVLVVSLIIAMLALLFLVINKIFAAMPDFAVRIAGIIILLDLIVLSFSMVRFSLSKKKKG
ncbi:MAG: hypothetical protein KA785_01495 [Spirochaetaceae bacterium]|nr:hypothetical protein [Spirochaetaceae bacterium]